jgi:hypothetical protein
VRAFEAWRRARRGGGALTDGVLRVLGGGLLGFYVAGWGRYDGEYLNGERHGRGIFTNANKDM